MRQMLATPIEASRISSVEAVTKLRSQEFRVSGFHRSEWEVSCILHQPSDSLMEQPEKWILGQRWSRGIRHRQTDVQRMHNGILRGRSICSLSRAQLRLLFAGPMARVSVLISPPKAGS